MLYNLQLKYVHINFMTILNKLILLTDNLYFPSSVPSGLPVSAVLLILLHPFLSWYLPDLYLILFTVTFAFYIYYFHSKWYTYIHFIAWSYCMSYILSLSIYYYCFMGGYFPLFSYSLHFGLDIILIFVILHLFLHIFYTLYTYSSFILL